jgi:hypothetical protein
VRWLRHSALVGARHEVATGWCKGLGCRNGLRGRPAPAAKDGVRWCRCWLRSGVARPLPAVAGDSRAESARRTSGRPRAGSFHLPALVHLTRQILSMIGSGAPARAQRRLGSMHAFRLGWCAHRRAYVLSLACSSLLPGRRLNVDLLRCHPRTSRMARIRALWRCGAPRARLDGQVDALRDG